MQELGRSLKPAIYLGEKERVSLSLLEEGESTLGLKRTNKVGVSTP